MRPLSPVVVRLMRWKSPHRCRCGSALLHWRPAGFSVAVLTRTSSRPPPGQAFLRSRSGSQRKLSRRHTLGSCSVVGRCTHYLDLRQLPVLHCPMCGVVEHDAATKWIVQVHGHRADECLGGLSATVAVKPFVAHRDDHGARGLPDHHCLESLVTRAERGRPHYEDTRVDRLCCILGDIGLRGHKVRPRHD